MDVYLLLNRRDGSFCPDKKLAIYNSHRCFLALNILSHFVSRKKIYFLVSLTLRNDFYKISM